MMNLKDKKKKKEERSRCYAFCLNGKDGVVIYNLFRCAGKKFKKLTEQIGEEVILNDDGNGHIECISVVRLNKLCQEMK